MGSQSMPKINSDMKQDRWDEGKPDLTGSSRWRPWSFEMEQGVPLPLDPIKEK